MQGQVTLIRGNGISSGQRIADLFKSFSNGEVMFHNAKASKIYQSTKRITITRYQRDYEVEFTFDDNNEVEFWSIDGNTDVEDTYDSSFLKAIKNKIEEMSERNTDNDEEYDDYFQNAV